MSEVVEFAPGGYRYVRGPFQYSAGVAAMSGFALERVRLLNPMPLTESYAFAESWLKQAGRPTTAFCACELRSPEPFDDAGFISFNREYVETLERWGIFKDDDNPVARSNVCPEQLKPAEPSMHAFTYTVPVAEGGRDFLIAGSGEAREAPGLYSERIVRLGETDPGAMTEKARFVLGAMEQRMALLGYAWQDVSATQVYTVHDPFPFFADEIVSRGAAQHALSWFYARPPVVGLDYEMDVRSVSTERLAR
ncbi:MAG: hypothetical protein AAF458_04050 [Pseudomonadota bacterium]